jgi:hypothetical protein
MIGLGIIHLFFVIITAILVFKVYKLVKFRDLPILLSIFSVFLSLLSMMRLMYNTIYLAMFVWLILFFFFIHVDKTSFLKSTNIMRMINFTGTMFFGIALVFDLYKWYDNISY